MKRYIYGNGANGTKYVTFEDAGFSMDNKRCYHIIEDNKEVGLLYFSETSFNYNLQIGLIKPLTL